MSWLLGLLRLGGLLRWACAKAVAAVRWLLERPVVLASLVTLALIGGLAWDRANWIDAAHSWQRTAQSYKLTLDLNEANVRAASAEAMRRAEETRRRVMWQQERINDHEVARLKADRADADSRYRSLLARIERAKAVAGGPGEADMPARLDATCRAFGAADCDGLLEQLPAILKAAQNNTDQLRALQAAAAFQATIEAIGPDALTNSSAPAYSSEGEDHER